MRYHTEVDGLKGFAEWKDWAEKIIAGAATSKLTNDE